MVWVQLRGWWTAQSQHCPGFPCPNPAASCSEQWFTEVQLARGPSHALSSSSAQKNKSWQKIDFFGGKRSWPRSFQAGAALEVRRHGDIQLEEINAGGSAVVQRGFGERFAAFFYQTSSVWCVCKAPALVEWHMTVVHLAREGAQGKEVPVWKILTFPAKQ